VLGSEVRVSQRHRNRFVPKQFANGVEIDASHDQLARKYVPQIVETKTGDFAALGAAPQPFLIATSGVVNFEPPKTHQSDSSAAGFQACSTWAA
jgi:hypothetical protein